MKKGGDPFEETSVDEGEPPVEPCGFSIGERGLDEAADNGEAQLPSSVHAVVGADVSNIESPDVEDREGIDKGGGRGRNE